MRPTTYLTSTTALRAGGAPLARARRGAGLTEYGLLAGLVAVISIGAVGGAGERVTQVFTQTGNILGDTVVAGSNVPDVPGGGSSAPTTEPETEPETAADCYDPDNVGTIGQAYWEGCAGMLIVDDKALRGAASDNANPSGSWTSSGGGDESFAIEGPNNMDYTFADSARNVFTGQVTDMSVLFRNTSFNGDIGYWDVSSVTDMSNMFVLNDAFNQGIGDWDVSSVLYMGGMFYHADAFNQDIGGWDVSSVIDMDRMFDSADAFNQDLSTWNVNAVAECDNFAAGASNWSASKPSFGSC